MFNYVKEFIKPYWNDFKPYYHIYHWWLKYYKWSCKRKLHKFVKEDSCVNLVIGLPRSGKSCYLAYLTHLCNVVGEKKVYCNVPIQGAYPYTKEDIGKYDMSNALVLLDEAGIMYDNRNFQNAFTEESLTWLKLIGHFHSNIVLCSQSMDIDAKWVRMSKDIYFLRRCLHPHKSRLTRIHRKLDVNPDTHKIEDFYEKPNGLLSLILGKKFYRKPYYKMFDSYSVPKLPAFPNLKKYQPYDFTKGV